MWPLLSPLTHLEDLREGALTNISGDSVAAGNDRTNGERELRLVLEAVDVRVEEERQRDVRQGLGLLSGHLDRVVEDDALLRRAGAAALAEAALLLRRDRLHLE